MSAEEQSSAVVLQGLVKSYGPVRAVTGVDLQIRHGETVALLGPNGAGKTTTIDMMLGLTKPDTGSVSLFGQLPRAAVARGAVGGMLQNGTLLRDLTVRELVAMVGGLYPDPLSVDDVLRITDTVDIADRRTQKLSGGQAQRVRFAMALVSNPELLILDEPTASLDVGSRREFWGVMRRSAALGKTVVFATHYLEEADLYADRVVVMTRGRIVADGPATEIKARVGRKNIRATLADVGIDSLRELPRCVDSDQALRLLLSRYPAASDIEVTGVGLEEAFIEITEGPDSSLTSGEDH